MHTQQCSRCRKTLTDYASMEVGVGPICRGRNNHLYSKLIKANGLIASINFLRDDIIGTIPEVCRARFLEAQGSFVRKFTKIQRKNHDMTKMVIKGADFRKEIEAIDYLLSFQMPRATREILISIIKDLGYVGLAAVICGEASKSKADIYFKNSRVFLEGTSCKAGWRKMRRLQGIITPRYRGEKTPFSAPAQECKSFLAIVAEHWPLYEGSLSDIQNQANVYLANTTKNTNAMQKDVPQAKKILAGACIVKRTNDLF